MSAVVLQSHALNPHPAVAYATETVRAWTASQGFDYRFLDDALFNFVSGDVMTAAGPRRQMAADIARLHWIAASLDNGAEPVIWLDADVLVFDPNAMTLPGHTDLAFGAEVWIQPDGMGGLKAVRNVHNAVLVFTSAGRVTLDFYLETATRLLLQAGSNVPPQFVGPKLLSALHNVVGFPLTDVVGMASPLVLGDLSACGGPALELLREKQPGLAAINLCSSLFGTETDGVQLSDDVVAAAIDTLLHAE